LNRTLWAIGLLLIGIVAAAGCLGGGEDEGEQAKITINGKEYVVEDIFNDFSAITITSSNDVDYTGIPLKDLLEDPQSVYKRSHAGRSTSFLTAAY